MIPAKSSACWRQLATGSKPIQTHILSLQMLLKRMQRAIGTNSDEATVQTAADEVHAFFVKYEKILANEIKNL